MDAKSLYPDPDTDPDPAFKVNPDTAEKKLSYFDPKFQFAYLYCPVQVPLPAFCTQPFSFPVKRAAYVIQKCTVFSSVADPDSLNLDPDMGPDPAFQVNPDTAEKKLSYFDQKLQSAYLYCPIQVPVYYAVFCTSPFSFPCQERALFYVRQKKGYGIFQCCGSGLIESGSGCGSGSSIK